MSKTRFFIFLGPLFCITLFFSSCKENNNLEKSTECRYLNSNWGCINNDWQFQYHGKWYPATVPGNIHDDLLKNKLIPDPYFGTNEDSVQWIADSTWTYRLLFDKDCVGQTHFENHRLIFEGLDTYAEVFINGKKMKNEEGQTLTDNMFRRWTYILPTDLKEHNNELLVKFLPSPRIEKQQAAKLSYSLPDSRALSRKAQYESGWDWGPKLITCGIWKNVYIESWNQLKLNDMHVYDTEPTTDKNRPWECAIDFTIECSQKTTARIHLEVTDNAGTNIHLEQRIRLHKGINFITMPVTIEHPILWWPNGMGAQHLYSFNASITNKEVISGNEKPIFHGLRTVKLKQNKDKIGESFEFYVNDKPVYMRGVNWIPASSYPGTLNRSTGNDVYYSLLNDCKDVNMNMIRIWGGGIYEPDCFYDYCDQFGILVWQDFMFAGSLCPGDKHFLNNVKQEAIEQVTRLRNHASMALWCGNNEIHNGWEDWGWQDQYSPKLRQKLYKEYSDLFEKLLPAIVRENEEDIAYIPSSPVYGWGHPECCTHGDSHYWGVWWGEEPFEVWGKKTGRFMSEYGFQSYPDMATIATFTTPADRELSSAVMKNHQKHSRGVQIIKQAMARDFHFNDTLHLNKFVYVSQLTQAEGIIQAIDEHRLQHDRCKGTLYWQLNDCWPVASWSSIDHEGHWKALHYQLRQAYANVSIAPHHTDNQEIDLYVINDSINNVSGKIVWQLMTLKGEKLYEKTIPNVVANTNTSKKVAVCNIAEIAQLTDKHIDTSNIVLHAQFIVGNKTLALRTCYFSKPGNLKLIKSSIQQKIAYFDDHFEITLTSPTLQYGVYISEISGKNVHFSDNYFDLLPNQPRKICGYYDLTLEGKPKLKVETFNNR